MDLSISQCAPAVSPAVNVESTNSAKNIYVEDNDVVPTTDVDTLESSAVVPVILSSDEPAQPALEAPASEPAFPAQGPALTPPGLVPALTTAVPTRPATAAPAAPALTTAVPTEPATAAPAAPAVRPATTVPTQPALSSGLTLVIPTKA